jgi:hypothetical protein
MDQEKLEKCLKEARADSRKVPGPIGSEYKLKPGEEERVIESYRSYMIKVTSFIQNCTIQIKKPSILRTASYWEASRIPAYQFLYVKPNVELTYLETCISIHIPDTIDNNLKFAREIVEIPTNVNIIEPEKLLLEFFPEEIVRLDEIRKIFQNEFDRVKRETPDIVKEFRGRRTASEKRRFQTKLAKLLDSFPNLVDVPPNILLAFMTINEEDTHALEKFAKRNRADVFVADEEDVIEAQKLGKVKKILES